VDNYICVTCSSNNFPFNYLDDDVEFANLLLNFFNDFPLFNAFNIDGPKLSILNNVDLTDDRDLNADLNYFNNFDVDSKYYLRAELHSLLDVKTSYPFSILHINARSLHRKLDNLDVLLKTINISFDVIAISETWETKLNEHLLYINGYTKYSRHRPNDERGGGVALFIKKLIRFFSPETDTINFESVFILN